MAVVLGRQLGDIDMPIPLPSANFGGQFAQGTQNLMNQLMNKQLREEQLAQQQKQFEQQQGLQRQQQQQQMKIHQDALGIQQQQQARLQQQFQQQLQDRAMLNHLLGLDSKMQDGQKPSEINMDAIRKSPLLRGAFKSRFGLDPAMETPEERQQREIQTAAAKEQEKMDVHVRDKLGQEIPKSKELMSRIEKAIPMIEENPELFGPGVGGIDFLGGPQQRYRRLKDPKKIAVFKHLSNLFAELQGKQASDFSSRSMKVAFDLAKAAKTSMEDHPEASKQTLQDMLQKMKALHQQDVSRFKKAGGKMPEPKRVKYNPDTGDFE